MKAIEKKGKTLELLRSLPQPGEVLLDDAKNGISGIRLRPKSIPQNLISKKIEWTSAIQLQIVKDGQPFGDNELRINTYSDEWRKWITNQSDFVIRKEDIGKTLDIIEDRRKNFHKNLLHEFLDQFSLKIQITDVSRKAIVGEDNYPIYFCKRTVSVSGTYRTGGISSIQTNLLGLESNSAIKHGNLYFKYWDLLSDDKKDFMKVCFRNIHLSLLYLLNN